MIAEKVSAVVENAVKAAGYSLPQKGIPLSNPEIAAHGDFATNIAFMLSKEAGKAPFVIAEEIAAKIQTDETVLSAEAVKPGFVNIKLTPNAVFEIMAAYATGTFEYAPLSFGPEKKLMVEYAHPNTLKLFHIGHLRNIVTGESLARMLQVVGNTVIRANYQGDVGMHIAKTLWKIKQMQEAGELTDIKDAPVREKIAIIGKAYAAETPLSNRMKYLNRKSLR